MHPETLDTLALMESGLDISKETVKGFHDFRNSMLAIQSIIGHCVEQEEFEAMEFFVEIGFMTDSLLVNLEVGEKGEIHFITEGEAARKLGSKWVLKHQVILKKKAVKERLHEETTIATIEASMKEIVDFFKENEEEFIHNEEIKDLFRRLSRLFKFYHQLFTKELARLRKLK